MIQGSNARRHSRGYTIVEVMIVLAVTGAMVLVVMLTVAGQQRKTEFSQAIHDIDSQVQDIANDITTGFYAKTLNFNCTASGSGPVITSTGAEQGTNTDCIFIGRVIQFAIAGSNGQGFNIYNVVGLRQSGGQDATSFSAAKPRVTSPSVAFPSVPDNTDKQSLQYGLAVRNMYYATSVGGPHLPIGAVGFLSTLTRSGGADNPAGTPTVNVMPMLATQLNQDQPTGVGWINALNDATPVNPAGGVVICFQSAGTDQYGVLTLASNGRALSTKLDILDSAVAVPSGGGGVCS